jgi:MFS family permease
VGLESTLRLMAVVPTVSTAMTALALARLPAANLPATTPLHRRHRGFAWMRSLPAGVWAAFLVALYINLVNGAMQAIFPIYGLSIGFTLAQVGAIVGIHGALASVVRFGGGLLLRRIGLRRLTSVLVAVSAAGVCLIAVPTSFVPLAATFAAIGLARGILRVTSGAIAVENAGASHAELGGASGVYLAGLDVGQVLGPIAAGAAAEAFGLRGAFPLVGVVGGIVYAGLAWPVVRRTRATGAVDRQPILSP